MSVSVIFLVEIVIAVDISSPKANLNLYHLFFIYLTKSKIFGTLLKYKLNLFNSESFLPLLIDSK